MPDGAEGHRHVDRLRAFIAHDDQPRLCLAVPVVQHGFHVHRKFAVEWLDVADLSPAEVFPFFVCALVSEASHTAATLREQPREVVSAPVQLHRDHNVPELVEHGGAMNNVDLACLGEGPDAEVLRVAACAKYPWDDGLPCEQGDGESKALEAVCDAAWDVTASYFALDGVLVVSKLVARAKQHTEETKTVPKQFDEAGLFPMVGVGCSRGILFR